jgi:uncharacterized protein (DUF1684 family)
VVISERVRRKGAPYTILFMTAAAVLAAACSSGPAPPDESSYIERVSAERADKERMFRESADSPIPPGKQEELLPLSYFPIDSSYSAPAVLKLSEDRPVFEMPTSTGKMRKMERVGVLEFTLGGDQRSLGAFVETGTRRVTRLFVPFSDLTSGSETYAAGRYLDLDPTSTGLYEIDFNRAYNPYCAYNETYDCPYPPPSNRLKIPIRAGERMRTSASATEDR